MVSLQSILSSVWDLRSLNGYFTVSIIVLIYLVAAHRLVQTVSSSESLQLKFRFYKVYLFSVLLVKILVGQQRN